MLNNLRIELHIFDLNDNLLISNYNLSNWQLSNNQKNILYNIHSEIRKAGFKSGNTKGKYELYMTKRIKSTAGDVVYIVSSQQDPTTFATNTVINDKVSSRGSFQIGTSTNCNEIVKKSTQD